MLKQVRDSLAIYSEELEKAVASGDITPEQAADRGGSAGVLRQIHVADDSVAAIDAVRSSTTWSMRVAKALANMGPVPLTERDFTELDLPEVDPDEVERILRHRVVAGDANHVRARLQHLREIGVGEVLCWTRWGFLTHEQATESMRRLSEHVL